MVKRSAVHQLPPEVKKWLHSALVEGNFSDYQLLEQQLREQGFHIGKSAIHRYGQKLERRLSAITASTEAARILTKGAPDDQDARSEAVIALVQTELFETILNVLEAGVPDLNPADRIKMLSAAAKNIATLTRASVGLKRYQQDIREKLDKAILAATADAEVIARKAGMSDEDWVSIRAKFLGIEV